MKKIELLAPVGSFDSLKAAVQNGANAVYLGGKDFSARASANNFDRNELIEAVKYCHIRGVQVFVTVNTLIKQYEIEDFVEYVKFLYDIDVDALIVQDIGMARLIKKLLPDFELHASTQMVAHSLEDVKYLKSVGFDRVVLARELNVDEIKWICENTTVDVEVFVHGALCVCYSGQCLMSSMIGNRSGNRGRCAQPCRQKYELIDINTGEVVNSNGDYLLSPRDLSTIEDLDKIIEAGVLSLKIEGRMKKPEYVATVVSGYREAINEFISENKINISEEIINNLYTIFNRKFTKGYILGEVGKDIMNSDRPNNQGLYVGKVLDHNRKTKRLRVILENTLKKGDGINLGGGTIGRIIKDGEITTIAHKGDLIELDFIGEAKRNQLIFKTSDSELMDKVQSTFQQDKELIKTNINAKVSIKLGEKPVLSISDFCGNKAVVEGEKVAEKAIKVALSEEKIETQIQKLGNTPYKLKDIDIDLDEGVSIPISILNQMRRDCIELLDEERIRIKERRFKESKLKYKPAKINRHKEFNTTPKLRVKVKNLEQLESVLKYNVDLIYYEDINTLFEALEIASSISKESVNLSSNIDSVNSSLNIDDVNVSSERTSSFEDRLIYSAPRIIRNREYKQFEVLDNIKGLNKIQIGNWGSMDYFKDKNLNIDCYLNTFNSESINHFRDTGANTVCLSQELNLSEIEQTLKYTDAEIEAVIYGYTPMMVTEYCPMGVVVRDCKKDKRVAKCKESSYALRDFTDASYRITQDIFCRSTIYNSKVTCMLDNLYELDEIGVDVFRIDFTVENSEMVEKVIEAHIEVLNNNYKLGEKATNLYKQLDEIGTVAGHYYKGVE
ncbi:U32 family peptidase [Clostridioides sp. ES-S-0145-01]|uniref:U32 family peptidase n=1 Tax=Clostridioides sp. ES-S-0145-01 TaxID=2770784 RepID=UPI001D11252E|nr:U32 family peptidase [Clostridioides sp. ES-S-0145-01]